MLEGYNSIPNTADARKGRGRPRAHPQALRLSICPSSGESRPPLRVKDLEIFPTTNSGKEARNCMLPYTFPWRTKAISIKVGVLGGIFVCLLVWVVSAGNKTPFSKPLPFRICPGLNSGDSKPHLPTSCSQLEHAQILLASAERLHSCSASAWEVYSESVLGLPLLEKKGGPF